MYEYHHVADGALELGFAELEITWAESDAAHDLTSAFACTWITGVHAMDLLDPRTAGRSLRRELATARLSEAPTPRRILMDLLAWSQAMTGDLAEGHRTLQEVTRPDGTATKYAAPYIALWEGRFDDARSHWVAQRDQERRLGNRRDEWIALNGLATLAGVEGAIDDGLAAHRECLELAIDGRHRIFELRTRSELALALADAGSIDEARSQIEQCRTIANPTNGSDAAGEDWRGVAGRIALAEAAVLVRQGRLEEAGPYFAQAIDRFGEAHVVWDEAGARHRWGKALIATNPTRAIEELAAALEVYRKHGAGTPWIERALSDKLSAQQISPDATQESIHIVATAALDERPDLVRHAAPDGTVTLLFSDIEGSTKLNDEIGDAAFVRVLRAHNEIVRRQISAHRGFEVKAQGDGFMVAFSSARRGIECAVAIQQALREHAVEHPSEGVAVRIGLHTGEAVLEEDDFFGKNVALAARVAGMAAGGQILVSSVVKELTDTGEIKFGPPLDVDLKGLSGRRRVYDVLWE
jgi:class 3 adenylate cyclase